MSTVGQSAIIRSLSIRPLFSFIGKSKGEINVSVTVQVHVHTLACATIYNFEITTFADYCVTNHTN